MRLWWDWQYTLVLETNRTKVLPGSTPGITTRKYNALVAQLVEATDLDSV